MDDLDFFFFSCVFNSFNTSALRLGFLSQANSCCPCCMVGLVRLVLHCSTAVPVVRVSLVFCLPPAQRTERAEALRVWFSLPVWWFSR